MTSPNHQAAGRGTALIALLTIGAGADLAAQDAPSKARAPQAAAKAAAASLSSLLQQLASTDPASWTARRQSMQSDAKEHRNDAKALRKQAADKQAAAERAERRAKALTEQTDRFAKVRANLAQLGFVDPDKKEASSQFERLLADLRKLPGAAWDAHLASLDKQTKAHQRQADELQAARKRLLDKAAARDASAASLTAEAKKLTELQALVAGLKFEPASKAKPAVAAAKAPQPTKPQPKKPQPKKPQPQKPQPKNGPATKQQPGAQQMAASKQPEMATDKVTVEPDKDLITYQGHVYPIFDEYCIDCHDAGDASGGLDLSTFSATLQGGSSGKTLVPGSADQSRLYLLVSHREKPTMPPDEARIDKPLLATIRTWIQQGAAKDLPQARELAKKRAAARRKAAAEARRASAERSAKTVVMPQSLPRLDKAYPERPGAMRAVAASPGAPLLAVPGFGQVLLLRQPTLQELGALEFPFGQVETLAFAQDGSTLLAAGGTAGQRGGAVLFDVRTGQELGRFGENRDVVMAAAVAPDSRLVAIGNTRRRVQVFRADGELAWQQDHDDWITALAFSPSGKLLASGDRQGNLAVREADSGREVHAFKAVQGALTALAFAPGSKQLATAGADRSISLYRMRDGRRLFRELRHQDQALCVAWQSATRLVSSGADGRIIVWKPDGSRDRALPRVAEWVYGIAVSHDEARVYTADWRGRLLAFDAKTRKLLAKVTPLAVTQ